MASKIAQKILAAKGITAKDFRAGSSMGEVVRRAGIPFTSELDRIARLPRRDWHDLLADDYVKHLSQYCRRPGGSGMLFDVQAAVLTEFADYKGFLGNIGLGEGKTLITGLAPMLLGAERPVLLAPGKLRKKTANDFKAYRKDWLIHPRLEFVSYEQLSNNPEILIEIDPDCLMCDEVHYLKNMRAGRTKRVARQKKKNPYLPFMGVSGTVSNRALQEFWHLLMWALLPERMPLPRGHKEVENWGCAVNEKVSGESRIAPGALIDVLAVDIVPTPEQIGDENPEIVRARLGIQRRLQETAGYISTTRMSCEASITIEIIRPARSKIIDDHIQELRETQKDENGFDLKAAQGNQKIRAADIWAKARQYSCGFVYTPDPPPPPLWREARLNKDRLVRWALDNFSLSLDTPSQVEQAIRDGKISKPFNIAPEGEKAIMALPLDILARWKQQEPLYDYAASVKPEWVDLTRMNFIASKVLGSGEEVIVWVEHVAVGEKLAELSGLPFYHSGGHAKNPNGKKKLFIDDARGPIIASVMANFEGRNLQHYNKNFIVSAPPVGNIWEQLIGRTHRKHQQADNIEVYVFEACPEHREGFEQARKDCANVFHTQGTPQRMLFADIVEP